MNDKKSNIAVAAIWYERFLECSRTYSTSEYPNSVWRFYHSLLNLGEGKLSVKDIIQDYVEKEWEPKKNYLLAKLTQYTTDSDVINFNAKTLEAQYVHEVFDRIVQTIQDGGIGWPTAEEMKTFSYSLD